MSKLEIKNLWVKVANINILKGVNLMINDHETVALLGPNGHGKSTLLSAIMGHPKYEITEGEILLDGKNVLDMEVDERSKAGLFLGMQHPSEVPGVINSDFLKAAINTRREKPISLVKLNKGELSTIDDIIRTVQQAKMAFEDLCNSKLTGNDGYSKEIDGIVNDFTKLEDKVRKSKETVSNFMVQNRERNKVDHMRQRNTDYMKKREDAEKNGRYYA
jgi:Fe-S cluster assembly ATP-binding protein